MFTDSAHTVKKASVIIPISFKQKEKLDSIVIAYSKETPYDYAFWGMRCASATYDILAQIDIVKEYSYRKTFRKIFYPKKLRKMLFKLAKKNKWLITREEGTHRRKWEKN